MNTYNMLILAGDACTSDLKSVLTLLKKGVIPLAQIAIIAALVVLLIVDFGKAVMAGKEDEIKAAQKLAIKRIVYAVVVFLVPFVVNVALGLIGHTNDDKVKNQESNALDCWNSI